MTTIDRFEWHMRNVPGVQSVLGIGTVAKIINAGWNEGSLKWRVLPRNPSTMAQAVTYIDTSTGLLNSDCSVMPVYIYSADHKAETIDRIVSAVKAYRELHGSEEIRVPAGHRQRRRHGGHQRDGLRGSVSDADVDLRGHHRALPDHLPVAPGDPLHRHPTGAGIDPRLRADDDPRDRSQDLDPAGSRSRCGHRCRLRDLHLRPSAEHPGRGRGLCKRPIATR